MLSFYGTLGMNDNFFRKRLQGVRFPFQAMLIVYQKMTGKTRKSQKFLINSQSQIGIGSENRIGSQIRIGYKFA